MQGVGSLVAGSLLLMAGGTGFFMGVPKEYSLIVMGLGGILAARGLFSIFTGQSVELTNAVDFVQNPGAAIVDGVMDRLTGADEPKDGKPMAGPLQRLSSMFGDDDAKGDAPAFDADAALARYMANRPEGSPAVEVPVLQPASPRGFGRKGL